MDITGSEDATLAQRLAAEALGTLVLVLVGCGSILFSVVRVLEARQASTPLAAFTFGFLIIALGYALGRTSGAHLNPVLSIAAAASGRLSWVEALRYCAAQLAGAIVGGALLLLLATGFPPYNAFDYPLGASAWGDSGTGYEWWSALLLEVLLAAFLAHVFLGATDQRNPHRVLAPVAVGLGFAALYFLSLPAVNGGIHPAKAIGVALFSGSDALGALYVFVIGPVLGALLAGLLHPMLFGRGSDPVPGSGLTLGDRASRRSRFETHHHPDDPSRRRHDSEPIIQDGWMWDAQAQQWVPAPIGVDPAGERTQIRRPDDV